MVQIPCGLLGCPSPLRLLINLWNFRTWKFHHASSVTVNNSASKFLILKRFDRRNKVRPNIRSIIHGDIFVASCGTKLEGERQQLGVQLLVPPCSNIEPPLPIALCAKGQNPITRTLDKRFRKLLANRSQVGDKFQIRFGRKLYEATLYRPSVFTEYLRRRLELVLHAS